MTAGPTEGMFIVAGIYVIIVLLIIVISLPVSLPILTFLYCYRYCIQHQKFDWDGMGIFNFPTFIGWLLYGKHVYKY